MAKVLTIGGAFFKCKDPKAMGDWYAKWLGLPDATRAGTRPAPTVLILSIVWLSSACTTVSQAPPAPRSVAPTGYSGMARFPSDELGGDRYLVVHDTKIHSDAARFGILETGGEEGVKYQALDVADWLHPEGRSSDLESVCALPGGDGEFLTAESGTWEGRFGRVFHVRVERESAEVVHVERIPSLADNGPDTWGDNFEGLACAARADGRVLVFLGERGGTRTNPRGSLRWALYHADEHRFEWSPEGLTGVSISAPGAWISLETKRDVADLYLDNDGFLWSVASEDAGDDGPFRSLIWALGRVDPDAPTPVVPFDDPAVGWTLDGLKVEALAAPPAHLPFAQASIGTEDENLGGVWRPLYPTGVVAGSQ